MGRSRLHLVRIVRSELTQTSKNRYLNGHPLARGRNQFEHNNTHQINPLDCVPNDMGHALQHVAQEQTVSESSTTGCTKSGEQYVGHSNQRLAHAGRSFARSIGQHVNHGIVKLSGFCSFDGF